MKERPRGSTDERGDVVGCKSRESRLKRDGEQTAKFVFEVVDRADRYFDSPMRQVAKSPNPFSEPGRRRLGRAPRRSDK